MAKPTRAAARSLLQTLKKYFKAPWEITGPCASPEYRSALPLATEFRVHCPATPPKIDPAVPTSDPDTVYDIKYYVRDQRRNRPPVKRTVIRKDDAVRMTKEKTSFDVSEFPPVYLTTTVVEDIDARGCGYQA